MDKWLEEASQIATWSARTVHKKYHTYFDMNDVKQEMLTWVLKHEKKVRSWIEAEDEEERKIGAKQLGKTLRRQAEKYCRKAKAQMVGYHLEDEAYYPAVGLPNLLPYVWGDVEKVQQIAEQRVSGGGSPAEGGNFLIQLFDIRSALDKLDPQDRMLLQMKYFEDMTFAQIAEVLDISDTTAHRKHDGALRRISETLGGDNPFTRKEIENYDMD